MTAPLAVPPNQATLGADPDPHRRRIEKAQAAGRQDIVDWYIRKYKLDPAAYAPARERTLGEKTGRVAGLAGRATGQAIESAAELPLTIADLVTQLAGGRLPEMLQPRGPEVTNALGLPQPATPGERVGVSIGEGAVTALPFALAGGAPAAMTVLGGLASGAGQTAAELDVGPLGQAAASAVMGGIPVAGRLGAEAIRSAVAGFGAKRAAAEQAKALFDVALGGKMATLGQVAQGGVAPFLEGGLRKAPGAAMRLQQHGERQIGAMERGVTGVSEGFSTRPAIPEVAGRAIQRGVTEHFVPRFRATAARKYAPLYQMVPEGTPVIPGHTLGLFAKQNSAYKAGDVFEGLDHPWMTKWSTNLSEAMAKDPNHSIPFGVLKDFRSRLGEILGGENLIDDLSHRDVRMLYGAVSEDMKAIIGQKGGAPALKAWDEASAYWRKGTDLLDDILQPLADKKTPEKAFLALESAARDGGTAARQLMRSLKRSQQRIVTATMIRRMGTATPGQQTAAGDVFSAERFLTNWNKIAPEAKVAFFDQVDPGLSRDLTVLAKAAETMRKAHQVMPQPSGTAVNTAFWSVLNSVPAMAVGGVAGGMAGGAAGAAAGIGAGSIPLLSAGASNLMARAFTNPKIVRWMVRQTKVPAGALSQELAILAKDAQKWEPEDREIAGELASTLGAIDWNQALTMQAVSDATAGRRP